MPVYASIPIISPGSGFAAFKVPHGLPFTPSYAAVQMTSTPGQGAGLISLDISAPHTSGYDGLYVYLNATDAGLTGILTVSAQPPAAGAGYTTVAACAASFPTFVRNGAKGPSDTLIQDYIDDEAAEIDAILERRFQEAISASGLGTFAAWSAAFSSDQLNLLEKINRFGACGEMAKVFAAMGVDMSRKMAVDYEAQSKVYLNRLNRREDDGKPLLGSVGGPYDFLFDSQAQVETPLSLISGVAGGDQPRETTGEEGLSNDFGKFDERGT